MTDQELRNILQDLITDKDRRAADRSEEEKRKKVETQFMAIAAYTGIAALLGGALLWAGDARMGQQIQPIANRQLVMESENRAQDKDISELKTTLKEGFAEIKAAIKSK